MPSARRPIFTLEQYTALAVLSVEASACWAQAGRGWGRSLRGICHQRGLSHNGLGISIMLQDFPIYQS